MNTFNCVLKRNIIILPHNSHVTTQKFSSQRYYITLDTLYTSCTLYPYSFTLIFAQTHIFRASKLSRLKIPLSLWPEHLSVALEIIFHILTPFSNPHNCSNKHSAVCSDVNWIKSRRRRDKYAYKPLSNYAKLKVARLHAPSRDRLECAARAYFTWTCLKTVRFLHRVVPFPINRVTVSTPIIFYAQELCYG